MLKRLSWSGFVVSELAMIGWAFVWPLAIDDDPASKLLQIGCLATLFVFLAALIGLLVVRKRSRVAL